MVLFVETEQLLVKAAQPTKETLQSPVLVKRAHSYCRINGSALNNRLDEGTYIKHVFVMLGLTPLNKYQLTHVKALIFYISRNQGIQEELLANALREELQIGKIENIQHKDYERVINFLRDIVESDDRIIERQ